MKPLSPSPSACYMHQHSASFHHSVYPDTPLLFSSPHLVCGASTTESPRLNFIPSTLILLWGYLQKTQPYLCSPTAVLELHTWGAGVHQMSNCLWEPLPPRILHDGYSTSLFFLLPRPHWVSEYTQVSNDLKTLLTSQAIRSLPALYHQTLKNYPPALPHHLFTH